jgi:uncharacterized membrane protein YkvI
MQRKMFLTIVVGAFLALSGWLVNATDYTAYAFLRVHSFISSSVGSKSSGPGNFFIADLHGGSDIRK